MTTIVQVPDPVLRQTARSVASLDSRVLNIINYMKKVLITAKNPVGVGLAAPQIGISLRIFITRPKPDDIPQVFINPEIIKYSQRRQLPHGKSGTYEGCLSLPGHYSPITRAMSVTVKYQTLHSITPHPPLTTKARAESENLRGGAEGEGDIIEKTSVFSGFPAHIIQHEMDHLNGILFIDRVLEQNPKLYKAEGDTWHEVTI